MKVNKTLLNTYWLKKPHKTYNYEHLIYKNKKNNIKISGNLIRIENNNINELKILYKKIYNKSPKGRMANNISWLKKEINNIDII